MRTLQKTFIICSVYGPKGVGTAGATGALAPAKRPRNAETAEANAKYLSAPVIIRRGRVYQLCI